MYAICSGSLKERVNLNLFTMAKKIRKKFHYLMRLPKWLKAHTVQLDLRKERRFIFMTIFALTLFGVLMIYESSSIYVYQTTDDPAYFFKRQFMFLLIGLGLFFLTLFVDLEFLRRHNKEILAVTFILLALVLVLGKKAGGARRWFQLGWINLQPSELLKISFLLYCADYFRRRSNLIRNFFRGVFPLWIVLGVICVLVALQPDLGSAIFWIMWTFLMLFLYRAKRRYLVFIIILGIVFSFFLIKFYPYRFRRITAYLDPFADPQGAGFQLIQSQIAYGEGGIFGVGFGEGKQKLFFLPAAHTDFIFSIIAEEFGLWGSFGILSIFFVIFHKMFRIAQRAREGFARGILWGIILVFFLEIAINIGVSCGLFPTKGLSLPFISYGGSNLIVHYILLGLFFNASRKIRTEGGISASVTGM
ncbi:MAG: putative lipid II flippase FtsW [Candidatus Omnitrophota bacterium]|nr:MAG: putative lipid II flippase FtsW [Candidatus Omnitrophota bacterium]